MRIAMPRSDIKLVRFLVYNLNGTATDIDFTEICFTVKKNARERQELFHKKLSEASITKLGAGDYQLKIEPEDTENLVYGNYKFDVQLMFEDQLKETFVGDFVIQDEVTSGYDTYSELSGLDATCVRSGNIHKLIITTPVAAGGGTRNYEELINKPSINDVILIGNRTLDELGIQAANPDIPQAAISQMELEDIINDVFGDDEPEKPEEPVEPEEPEGPVEPVEPIEEGGG